MITKVPACYDLSHYIKKIQDFKLIEPKPAFLITKATEADPTTTIHHTDEKFVDFFSRMMDIFAIRGAYHFHRKYANPYKQADHFLKVISQMDILPTDFLILDVEEGGEKAASLWAWFETVRKAYPDNRLMLYSRKNLLDPIYMTVGERAYFKKIRIWTAGYPYFPDLYSKVPNGYIPDQTKYGPVGLWQYSGSGKISGIDGEVDLNWIEPQFYATLGSNVMETVMANQIWEVISATPAKVWEYVGGVRTYPDLTNGTRVTISSIEGDYLHLISPRTGVSKKEWFKYIQDVPTEPPPPPPPPPPSNEYILYVKDGVTRKFIPE